MLKYYKMRKFHYLKTWFSLSLTNDDGSYLGTATFFTSSFLSNAKKNLDSVGTFEVYLTIMILHVHTFRRGIKYINITIFVFSHI